MGMSRLVTTTTKVAVAMGDLTRGDSIAGTVRAHHHWGVSLELVNGDQGYIDAADLARASYTHGHWPPIGSSVTALFLLYGRDGRAVMTLVATS
jgi:hypothetical protein